jgi:hypothetical protein
MTDQGQSTPEGEQPVPPPSTQPDAPEQRPALGDTVGTGTSIALGCVAATIVLILVGLIFLLIVVVAG